MTEYDPEKWDQEQQEQLAYTLADAIQDAMNIDQLLYEEVYNAVVPIIKKLRLPIVRCGVCKKEMEFIEWAMAQGMCDPCIAAVMASEGSG